MKFAPVGVKWPRKEKGRAGIARAAPEPPLEKDQAKMKSALVKSLRPTFFNNMVSSPP